MDRMSAMDAMFYYMEDENTPMHVGGVAVLEGPAPAYGDIVRLLSKLDRVPWYRQLIKPVPLHLGRPIWVDDPHFQILYHVRHTAPEAGGDEQLRNLAGRVFAQRLDMSKPVWEAWLVEGLARDRWALISKAHHAMIDGEGSTDLMQVIFDLEQNPERPEPADWHPQPFPSTLTVTAGLIRDAVQPLQLLRMPSRSHSTRCRCSSRGPGRRQGTPALGPPDPRARAGTADAGQHERPVGPNRQVGERDDVRGEDPADSRGHRQRRHPYGDHPATATSSRAAASSSPTWSSAPWCRSRREEAGRGRSTTK